MDGKKVQKVMLIFLGCTAGTVILQLAAPLILGIFVNVASFTIPFAVYYLYAVKKWRIKMVKPSEEKEQPGSENEAAKEDLGHGSEQQEETPNQAYHWYAEGGRERIEAIASSILTRGIKEFWIRTDGICNIRTPKGYRRIGSLPGYPGREADAVTEYLKQDGFNAVNDGRYIYVCRKAGGLRGNGM